MIISQPLALATKSQARSSLKQRLASCSGSCIFLLSCRVFCRSDAQAHASYPNPLPLLAPPRPDSTPKCTTWAMQALMQAESTPIFSGFGEVVSSSFSHTSQSLVPRPYRRDFDCSLFCHSLLRNGERFANVWSHAGRFPKACPMPLSPKLLLSG
jgi:hypothetical protein